MVEETIAPMREEFPRWYRLVDMSDDRARLQARWHAIMMLVQDADRKQVETMVAVALRAKVRPSAADLVALRGPFRHADDLFDSEGNDRELEILCSAALVTIFDRDDDRAALAALATVTASCAGARTADFPLNIVATAESAIARLAERRRVRPDLAKHVIARASSVGFDADTAANLKLNFNGDAIVTAMNTMAFRIDGAFKRTAEGLNAAVRSANRFIAIQDEELQMLWWLFGGRSTTMDRPFGKIPEDARPIVMAAELATATELLPGPPSLRSILSRADLKERKVISIPAVVNACDIGVLTSLLHGVTPSPLATPMHFAISRRLETGDVASWIAGWAAVTGIDAGHSATGLDLGSLFFRERLYVLFGA